MGVTVKQKLIAVLESRGSAVDPNRSGKWVAMTSTIKSGEFWFVGQAGGLRHGRTKSASLSMPRFRIEFIAEYDKTHVKGKVAKAAAALKTTPAQSIH